MSITTYAELQTAIQNWLDRSGSEITGNAPDFIALATARLNRVLPLRTMWTNTTLTATVSSRAIALPSNFVEPVELYLTTSGDYTRLPQFVAGTVELETSNADPAAWCINGENINLDAPANSAHTFDFWYRKSFALDDSNTTNWLLTNAPDVYLWASLLMASVFAADKEFGMVCKALLEEAITEAKELAARSQSGAELRTDPGLRISRSRTGYFNYNTGL
jgi:hypothetical protein